VAIIEKNQQKTLHDLRQAIPKVSCSSQVEIIRDLAATVALPESAIQSIQRQAEALISGTREAREKKGGIDAFMAQYDLSQEEGITLMCLAEAMLRIPDKSTVDDLIRDKLSEGDWEKYVGKSDSSFVNTATYGLMLSGKVAKSRGKKSAYFGSLWQGLVKRVGEPVIRQVMGQVMKVLGEHFVMGQTIEKSIKRARKNEQTRYRYSYDMLGEAALTQEDAAHYFSDYEYAIKALEKTSDKACSLLENPGISVKLSALYPKYDYAHHKEAVHVLVGRVLTLVGLARQANVAITIDAEEVARREVFLSIIEQVFCHPLTRNWEGFGFAVQAYSKSAYALIEWSRELARSQGKRLLIRLVKGAYWDTEIKDSQVRGLPDYPVFTVKAFTDICYLACAKQMIDAKDEIYCQFATHNAMSVVTLLHWMKGRQDFEFQCLHGMGQTIYDQLLRQATTDTESTDLYCRVYAPVGSHKDLLPYLVRRLLENGANTSFVNQIMQQDLPIAAITKDPMTILDQDLKALSERVPLPRSLYLPRKNSYGEDLSDPLVVASLFSKFHQKTEPRKVVLSKLLKADADSRKWAAATNPAHTSFSLGQVELACELDVAKALLVLDKSWPAWSTVAVSKRAQLLRDVADELEARSIDFFKVIIQEAGKTWQDAVDEVREAVDFLRYYADEAERVMEPVRMPGPTGEDNIMSLHPRGVVFCLSPWNFPLAIFIGQVAAALVTGNVVLAKPASQTALVADLMVQLMYEAGLPREVLIMLIGSADVVAKPALVDPRVSAVMLTGSNKTARSINQALAAREGAIIPFIAETGGQNCMIVDSSALPEQVVTDVMQSAFQSAGQRCSAMRVLFVQKDIAPTIEKMLIGAVKLLVVGDPSRLETDVGPIIDEGSKDSLVAHQQYLDECDEATLLAKASYQPGCDEGTFFAPRVYRLANLDLLEHEVFGPILHIIHYEKKDLPKVLDSIHATGFGLTLGVHSRIDSTIEMITSYARVGNQYVNRNTIGAVVGVQPFGGEGLSGTGPKAGGPHYLLRLCHERTLTVNTTAIGGNATLMMMDDGLS
jgi:RHH-type transcriptional regulator, proline utilization regulon repressor / proline dehydrogenase / delta 1-pyrroline-5-carboxylate dehydrogenase